MGGWKTVELVLIYLSVTATFFILFTPISAMHMAGILLILMYCIVGNKTEESQKESNQPDNRRQKSQQSNSFRELIRAERSMQPGDKSPSVVVEMEGKESISLISIPLMSGTSDVSLQSEKQVENSDQVGPEVKEVHRSTQQTELRQPSHDNGTFSESDNKNNNQLSEEEPKTAIHTAAQSEFQYKISSPDVEHSSGLQISKLYPSLSKLKTTSEDNLQQPN